MNHKAKRKMGRPAKETTLVQVSVLLDPAVAERLDVLAKEQRRSRSGAASLLIEGALDAAQKAG